MARSDGPSRLSRARAGLAVAFLAIALAGAGGLGSCQERQLSGQDLQTLQIETLRENQGKLSAEEEMRIRSIRAQTRSQYDQAVREILAKRKRGSGLSGE